MEGLGWDYEVDRERYERQSRLAEIGEGGQMRVRNASVLLVGVGGRGSPIARYLAAAGVGRIGLVDPDVVSISNLQRQVLYTTDQIGKSKVECAKERLLALNPAVRIDLFPAYFNSDLADRIVADYDILIDGCDNYPTRYLLNEVSVRYDKPYVYGCIGEFHGQVAVFNYKGGSSYRDLFPEETELCTRSSEIKGVMGVMPGIIGTYQAAEVIKIITGAGEPLRNQLLTIDLLINETRVLSF